MSAPLSEQAAALQVEAAARELHLPTVGHSSLQPAQAAGTE